MTANDRPFAATHVVLALIWLGMLLGVSFLATPVKFLAPSLSLSVALDVGRQTFGVFNPVEALLALMLLINAFLLYRIKAHARLLVISGLLLLLVLIQSFWLLPVLDSRVEIILQGDTPPPSMLHRLYIVWDLLKLVLLGVMAASGLRILLRN